jgi:hypothetical protein
MIKLIAAAVVAVLAVPVSASASMPDKPALLAKWTQPTAAAFADWQAARSDRESWKAYGFIWTTDYCTGAPERPIGFDFRLPCARHDFGYRNYRAAGTLARHKGRLDRAFRQDLNSACGRYRMVLRPFCRGLAWTYYRAVRRYGMTRA